MVPLLPPGDHRDGLERLFVMKQEHDQLVLGLGRRAENGARFLAYIYDNPVCTIADAAAVLDVSFNTARGLVEDFEKMGLLQEATGFGRNRQFQCRPYLDCFGTLTPKWD